MKKRCNLFSTLYTFSYMALGALMPLIGQYLAYIGFTGVQIGTITAAGTCVAIFASTVWGKVYDSGENKYLLIMALCIIAAIIGTILLGIKWYPLFIAVYGCMYFFQAPIMAFSDALTLQETACFGQIRKWGAVGFAVGVFAAGRLAELMGLPVIFHLYSGSFFLSALLLLLLSRENSAAREASHAVKKEKRGYRILLREKKLMQLLVCAFFLGGSNVANNTYFSFLYLVGGGTLAGVGAVMLLMVGSVAPFIQWSAKLAGRFSMEKTILGAMAVSVIRFGIYALEPAFPILMAMFFMQGAVNGIILVEFVRYVTKLAPKGNEGMAVAVYYAFSCNGSAILCQLVGGAMLDCCGSGGVYGFFAVSNLVGLVLYMSFGLQKKHEKLDGK